MERRTSSETLGCGSSHSSEITLNIQTTTGGNFSITCENNNSVDQLKKIVSKKLKVSKDRICLLHRERQLRDGTLEDNGLMDGSRVILLPSVETGLLTQRPENSVMQALESLNDSQVNDFLSGKSPLNLTMRLGDHMMLIQLQLSTLNPVATHTGTTGTSKSRPDIHRPPAKRSPPTSKTSEGPIKFVHKTSTEREPETSVETESPDVAGPSLTAEDKKQTAASDSRASRATPEDISFLRKQDIETLQNAFEIFKSLAEIGNMDKESDGTSPEDAGRRTHPVPECSTAATNAFEGRSPIESLSNLVSSPLKSSMRPTFPPPEARTCEKSESQTVDSAPVPKYVPLPSSLKNNLIESMAEDTGNVEESGPGDPIAANLTSCLCSTLDPDCTGTRDCHPSPSTAKRPLVVDSHTGQSNGGSAVNSFNVSGSSNSSTNVSDSLKDSSSVEKDKYHSEADSIPTSRDSSESSKNKRLHYLLHRTSKRGNPVGQSKQRAFMQSVVNKHLKKKMQRNARAEEVASRSSDLKQDTSRNTPSASGNLENKDEPMPSKPETSSCTPSFDRNAATESSAAPTVPPPPSASVSDAKALIEASKNLTQTLKKLSKEVLTSKVDPADEESARSKIGQGAVIESMKHHGKGIYSGTFSGTLNPALQDRFGRPKRDISTIIHILNDLLCATPPQYRRGARITFEPTHNSSSSTRSRQRESRQHSVNCSSEQRGLAECGCSKCNSSSGKCPYGECNGHYPSPNPASDAQSCSCKSSTDFHSESSSVEMCSCSSDRLVPRSPAVHQMKKCHMCSDKDEKLKKSKNCRKCHTATALALENSKTKCKLDQLRLVMQQKKQRREARKMKTAPYVTSANVVSSISQSEAPSVIAEEIDTVA